MPETPVTVRITHAEVNGVDLAVSNAGPVDGPVVVLLHGFPDIGYAWRHQIRALASAGYRVLAPDQRGHGWSDAPPEADAYRIDQLVADVIGLVDAEGASSAVVVGHDWGVDVAGWTALMHPERVRAVAMLSEAFAGRPDPASIDLGPLDAAEEAAILESDPISALRRLQWAGCGRRPDGWEPGDPLPSGPAPHLSQGEFENYFRAYAKTGFATPLHVLANHQANWEATEPWHGASLDLPAIFVAGDRDPVPPDLEGLRRTCSDLRGHHVIEGAGHWLQQEAPEQVSNHLLAFLEDLA